MGTSIGIDRPRAVRGVGAVTRRFQGMRYSLALPLLIAVASMAEPAASPPIYLGESGPAIPSDFSVMTYNVKGMPWPLASGRPAALRRIGQRLARMRALHRQPTVVVLQEAFTAEAKAIAGHAGYPFVVEGPYTRAAPSAAERAARNWFLGETQAAVTDSGLVILSDLPVRAVSRAAFPPAACAGWDCLAAKGMVLVTLDLPGKGALSVATMHFNCQGASGASKSRTTAAYTRQAAFMARFLRSERQKGAPLVVAGDFNRGNRPARQAALEQALAQQDGAPPLRDALSVALDSSAGLRASPDARLIHSRGRDLQYAFAGSSLRPVPVDAEVPFGTETDGTALSDHMGYTVRYRLLPAGPEV